MLIDLDFSRYYDFNTKNVSRRKTKRLREELFNLIKEDVNSVRRGICYKVTLPLISAHKLHEVSPHCYWDQRLKNDISKRAEVLIKQGICHKQILKEMLNSFIENELLSDHALPTVCFISLFNCSIKFLLFLLKLNCI